MNFNGISNTMAGTLETNTIKPPAGIAGVKLYGDNSSLATLIDVDVYNVKLEAFTDVNIKAGNEIVLENNTKALSNLDVVGNLSCDMTTTNQVITNLITAPGSPPVVIGGFNSKITVNNSAIQVECGSSVSVDALSFNIDANVIPSATATLGRVANPWLSSYITELNADEVKTGLIECDDFKLTSDKIKLGINAGLTNQGVDSVAIGSRAGETNQGSNSVALGILAGRISQGVDSVAIGSSAGVSSQGINSVAIGFKAGKSNQGQDSVAIGNRAGEANQANNSIVINGTGSALNGTTQNALYINPIRNDSFPVKCMNYNPSSKEVTYTNMGNYIEANSSIDSDIDSSSPVDIGGMSVSPPSGNYMATFSCWLENAENNAEDGLQVAIYINGSVISHSIRKNWTGQAGLYETSLHTQAIVVVASGDTISVKGSRLGSDRIKVGNRSLILISLGTVAS